MLYSLDVSGLDLTSLRHRVTLERQSSTLDDAGDWTDAAWTQVRTLYAEVNWISGSELQKVQTKYADARFTITFRYQPDIQISDKDRLSWNGKMFEILGVDDVQGRQIAMVAYCREWQK